ncbi:MAG: hypothetical protein LBG48_05395 [Rickettsiales bacterium]|jgi:hypothetical protein|nr:hypothetical protein [Rickettsiales bacterium]
MFNKKDNLLCQNNDNPLQTIINLLSSAIIRREVRLKREKELFISSEQKKESEKEPFINPEQEQKSDKEWIVNKNMVKRTGLLGSLDHNRGVFINDNGKKI